MNIHTFGCPAYVLDKAMQGGFKAGKWNSRARMAVFLGPSPNHARSVGLVLSLTTGLVSPQYHVKYDDTFETLRTVNVPKSLWQSLAGFASDQKSNKEIRVVHQEVVPARDNLGLNETDPVEVHEDRSTNSEDASEEVVEGTENEDLFCQEIESQNTETHDEDASQNIEVQEPKQDSRVTAFTRSGRSVRLPVRYNDIIALPGVPGNGNYQLWMEQQPHALYTTTNDNNSRAPKNIDTMYLHEAMKAPDKHEFLKAMSQEIQAHVTNKNWILIQRTEVPVGKSVLPAIWAMRRKRDIATRQVYKWKARLNIHGGKQVKGLDY
jgi:hypothetical protein